MHRNLVLLSISQALMITCTSLMLTTSALVGRILADNKALAMQHHAHPFPDTAFVIQWHVFGTVTLTSFSSGAVQHALGWQSINLGGVPFLALVLVADLWLRRKV
jgi:hypothetical protein